MTKAEPFLLAHPEQVKKRVSELSRRSDDVKSRLAPILKKLWHPNRELAVIRDLNIFQNLKSRFPNFLEVIELFESNAIGLSKLGLPFELTPILLQGDPGLGKTFFVSELAKVLGLPFCEISMATMTASFALSGGSLQWSEGSIGFIAKSLANSKFANPIILIDEIDKCNVDSRYDPINTLYSLLEPHSAKRFKDEALEVELDASRVVWIATANDINKIPDPILSRMRVIDIKQPNVQQMKDVVNSIYSNFRASKPYGELLAPNIEESVIDLLSVRSPREVRMLIDTGCLNAIRENRKLLQPSDIPVTRKDNRRVGFY